VNDPDMADHVVDKPKRGRKPAEQHGLIVPAELFLELVRVYKRAPPDQITRKLWLEAHRLEAVAQSKFYRDKKGAKK
jgi:hypothetical protein